MAGGKCSVSTPVIGEDGRRLTAAAPAVPAPLARLTASLDVLMREGASPVLSAPATLRNPVSLCWGDVVVVHRGETPGE